MGTTEQSEASVFYIEKHVCPGEFNIAYYGEQYRAKQKKRLSKYLTTRSKMSGKDPGPLQMGGPRAANLTLRHPSKAKSTLDTEEWTKDACYIRLAPRKMQKKSYVAFAGELDAVKSVCVQCREEEGCITRFNLNRVEIDCSQVRCRLFSDGQEQERENVSEIGSHFMFKNASLPSQSTNKGCQLDRTGWVTDSVGQVARGSRVACDGEIESCFMFENASLPPQSTDKGYQLDFTGWATDIIGRVARGSRVACDGESGEDDYNEDAEDEDDLSDFDFELEFNQISDSDSD